MKHDHALLRRVRQLGEASVGRITRGLIYSDDETVHDMLFWYRAMGLVSFRGNEISDRTVIRARKGA